MFWKLFFLISTSHALLQAVKEPQCTIQGTSRTIKLSVNSKMNPSGVWLDSLSAWTESSNHSEATQMDIAQTVTECQGKRITHIYGVTQDSRNKRFKFHPRCGKNVAILDKGLTAQKLNIDDPLNSVVFTNRPMEDEEIFEVMIEGKNDKFDHSFGIGIMTKTPTDVDILPEMFKSEFVWMYHNIHLYTNGTRIMKNTGMNSKTFQVGDRVGVMRSEMRTLHFFLNGKDQGPAMSNVPSNVYGVVDLRGGYEKARIV